MQAQEASPEAGGHSLLLNGGLAGMEAHAGLARGCDGPKQGMSLLPPCTGKKEKKKKRDRSERQAGQLAGSTSERLPHCKCAE